MSSHSAVFRFCDLPCEIRTQVYRELLCSFKPRPTTVDVTSLLQLPSAKHDIDSTILRTSKAVYHEANDVMVKTNRFVKITSPRGLPLPLLLNGSQVPIVSSNQHVVQSFKGYVLAVHLGTAKPVITAHSNRYIKPCTLMILHRDMDIFCDALTDGDAQHPGFSENLQISMTVAPILAERQPDKHSSTMNEFFSDTTQKALLAPFRTTLRGYKSVQIKGYVGEELARAVQEDMNRDRWSDPKQVLTDFAAEKERGTRLFQQRKMDDSYIVWQDAAANVYRMVGSSSWPTLLKRGGEQFVSQLAELYFLVRLNVAHVEITKLVRKTPSSQFSAAMAEDALDLASQSLRKDYWMPGYKYRPSNQHLAKLRYRTALLLRLQAVPGTSDRASKYIVAALRLQPDDPVIIKERDNIVAWLKRGY